SRSCRTSLEATPVTAQKLGGSSALAATAPIAIVQTAMAMRTERGMANRLLQRMGPRKVPQNVPSMWHAQNARQDSEARGSEPVAVAHADAVEAFVAVE